MRICPRMMSGRSLKYELRLGGAEWVNQQEGIVTSRNPDDIPAFNAKMIGDF